MDQDNRQRLQYIIPFAAILSVQLIIVVGIAFAPREFLMKKLTDDAFYFYKTAQHMAAGNGMTFDGIHRTNGMQVIWVVLLTPVYWLFEGLWLPVRASIILQGIIALGAAGLFYRAIYDLFDYHVAVVATVVLIFNPYVVFMYLGGHEAALNLFFLTGILYLLVSKDDDAATLALLGMVCGFAFLVRLDNVILIAILGGVLLGTGVINSIQKLAALSITATALPIIYILYNIFSFGHIIPVSGEVLSSTSTIVVLAYVFACAGLALVFSYFVIASDIRSLYPGTFDNMVVVSIFTLAGVTHLLYYVLFQSRLAIWYLVLETLVITLVGASVLAMILRIFSDKTTIERMQLITLGLVIVILVSYSGIGASTKFDPNQDELGVLHYQQAKYLRTHTACDAVIGSGNAGMLGYFSQRSVVELNGLANSYRFVERYNGNHSKYIIERRPDYVVDYRPHLERQVLKKANYSLIRKISVVTEVQTPLQPSTLLSSNNQLFVHEIWKANGATLNSNPEC